MLRDLRHAIHTLGRSPGYTLLSIVVLALGIGANAAIFSVLDSVVLHALPYPDPGRLVFVWERFPALPPPMGPRMFVARSNFTEWQRQATVFSRMAAFTSRTADETSSGHPRHVDTGYASAALFPLLGAAARLGRLLPADTGRAGNDGVAVAHRRLLRPRVPAQPRRHRPHPHARRRGLHRHRRPPGGLPPARHPQRQRSVAARGLGAALPPARHRRTGPYANPPRGRAAQARRHPGTGAHRNGRHRAAPAKVRPRLRQRLAHQRLRLSHRGHRSQGSPRPVRADDGHRPPAAHRLRQPRQPHRGASHPARARTGAAARARRHPRPPDLPTDRRAFPALRGRRRVRPAPGALGCETDRGLQTGGRDAAGINRDQPAGSPRSPRWPASPPPSCSASPPRSPRRAPT